MEGWHIIVTDPAATFVIYYEFFSFDELSKTFKISYRQEKQGKYSLNIAIMSDCYFGLDIIKDIKYEVGAEKKMYEEKVAEVETEEDESYIRKIFNSLVPQEE